MRKLGKAAFAVAGIAAAGLLAAPSPAQAASGSVSFTTAGCSTWTVPDGVTTLAASAVGSAGDGQTSPALGGRGDGVSATLAVTPGVSLRICVAVGGGAPGSTSGGAGGGASGIALGSDFSAPLIIAGGGGGRAYGDGTTYFSSAVKGYDAGFPTASQPSPIGTAGALFTSAGPGVGGNGTFGFAQQGSPFIPEDGYFFTSVTGGGGGGGYRGGDGGAGIATSAFGGSFQPGGGGTDYCGQDRRDVVLACTLQDNIGTLFGPAASGGSARVDLTWTATPVVTLTPDRPANSAGWYTAPVTYTVTSDTASDACDAPVTFSGPDSATASVTASCTSAAGPVGTNTASLAYDATAPTLDITDGPADGGSYVFGSVPAAPACVATDATSGLDASGCVVSGYSTALGSQTLTFTAADAAGNRVTQSRTYTVTGSTPTISGTPTGGKVGSAYSFAFTVGGVPAPSVTLASGSLPAGLTLSTAGVISGTPTAPGTSTFTVTVFNAVSTVTGGPYSVTIAPKFTLSGFYQPVDLPPVVNTVKGGATVPLKFEVFSNGVELTDVAAIGATFRAVSSSCSGGATDDIEVVTTGGTSLRYDTASGMFVQNWQTPKTPGACLTVSITLSDGTTQTALFKLK